MKGFAGIRDLWYLSIIACACTFASSVVVGPISYRVMDTVCQARAGRASTVGTAGALGGVDCYVDNQFGRKRRVRYAK